MGVIAPYLRAGMMGSPADPTTVPPEFAGSMAAYMDAALDKVLQGEGMPPLDLTGNTSDDRNRRMIFVAIAQGVVEYLAANSPALQVDPLTLRITINQADAL
jgi:hypothetical protein